MSKYSNQVARNEEDLVVETVQVVQKPVKAKAPKKRRERPYRIFNYRGITFFLINKGDNTIICTLDADKKPHPRIEVPRAQAIKAAQALAKLSITESTLDEMGAKPTKQSSVDFE